MAGRIYVETGGNDLLRIVMFNDENKRNRVIERDKRTDKWHAHVGYLHSERGKHKHDDLTATDKELIDKIKKKWQNRYGKI